MLSAEKDRRDGLTFIFHNDGARLVLTLTTAEVCSVDAVPREFRRRADFAELTSWPFTTFAFSCMIRAEDNKGRTMSKTQKPLTLLQLWAAKRVKEENEKFKNRPIPTMSAEGPPTKKQRKLARIIAVHTFKRRGKSKQQPVLSNSEATGKLPTAWFVQGGRPESKRSG
jgi:hypothetical protein